MIERLEKTDRRSLRSQRLLSEALIALILEKGYAAVTIKEIADRADVAYVTFYRHYRDKDDLLNAILSTSLIALVEQIETAAREAFAERKDTREGLLVFRHVQEHANLYRILLSSQGILRVRKQVQDRIAEVFLRTCPPIRSGSALIPGEILANHIAAGLLTLIEWWLEHGMVYPLERMAQIYHEMVVSAAVQTLSHSDAAVKNH